MKIKAKFYGSDSLDRKVSTAAKEQAKGKSSGDDYDNAVEDLWKALVTCGVRADDYVIIEFDLETKKAKII